MQQHLFEHFQRPGDFGSALLLYLYFVAISYFFKATTKTPEQHSTEPFAEFVMLTLRGKGTQAYLFVIVGLFHVSVFLVLKLNN